MDEMVDRLSHDHGTRSGEENLVTAFERPADGIIRILRRGDRLARFLYMLVERLDKILGFLVRVSRILAEVQRSLSHGVGDPARHSGDELGEMSERKGLRVRLELSFVGGDSLDHLAGRCHLLIELGQQRVANAHVELPESVRLISLT
jgi:hypothetical protein